MLVLIMNVKKRKACKKRCVQTSYFLLGIFCLLLIAPINKLFEKFLKTAREYNGKPFWIPGVQSYTYQ